MYDYERRDTERIMKQLEDAIGLAGVTKRVDVAFSFRDRSSVLAAERGIRRLPNAPPWWIEDLRTRLSDANNDADSVIGELRALGTLFYAFADSVEPVRVGAKPTADFNAIARDNSAIAIDVFTRGLDAQQKEALAQFFASQPKPKASERISFAEHSFMPYGAPRTDPTTGRALPGDTVTANVVQRICGIKQKETQFEEGRVNLIYIDLQRGDGLAGISIDSTFPLISHQSAITTGELFAAFYGRKGIPIYENRPLDYGACSANMTPMAHDGRFRQETKLSGVIVACKDGVALLENPWARTPLSSTARNQLIECFGARIEYFWACFVSSEDLQAKIEQSIQLLERFRTLDFDVEDD
jgi:hypothetical protein